MKSSVQINGSLIDALSDNGLLSGSEFPICDSKFQTFCKDYNVLWTKLILWNQVSLFGRLKNG